jgi:hypothetical protein
MADRDIIVVVFGTGTKPGSLLASHEVQVALNEAVGGLREELRVVVGIYWDLTVGSPQTTIVQGAETLGVFRDTFHRLLQSAHVLLGRNRKLLDAARRSGHVKPWSN